MASGGGALTLLLLLALSLGLLDGVSPREQAAAKPILLSARRQLEEHYKSLGFRVTPDDRWPEVVQKLQAGRLATWDIWRRELEWDVVALAAYPQACLVLPKATAAPPSDVAGGPRLEGIVRQKQPERVVWLEDARDVLLGLDEELPPEIAYGYQVVGPAWFFWMRTTLEQAGAPTVAARLAALQPVKAHWFQRQLEVYQALSEGTLMP